jgi:MoaA/NifB/PqqE/SkfB family radical SAM enzyme
MFSFFGGEPLLRKDILAIIDLIQEILPSNSVAITTNGTLLRKYADELLKRNIALAVSLDGISPEVNDKVRGAGTFKQNTGNLAYLVARKKELKDSKAPVSIAYTITSYSEEPEEIIRFCEEARVDSLIISAINETGSAARNSDLLVDRQKLIGYIERVYLAMWNTKFNVDANLTHPLFMKYFNAKHGADLPYQYAGCRTLSTNFYIRPNGVFTACLAAYPDGEVFKKLGLWEPSLIDHRLEDILKDESFLQMAKYKNPGSYPGYTPCNECGFAGSYCDPCWIDCYLGRPSYQPMCSLVAGLLDEMQVEWRKSSS